MRRARRAELVSLTPRQASACQPERKVVFFVAGAGLSAMLILTWVWICENLCSICSSMAMRSGGEEMAAACSNLNRVHRQAAMCGTGAQRSTAPMHCAGRYCLLTAPSLARCLSAQAVSTSPAPAPHGTLSIMHFIRDIAFPKRASKFSVQFSDYRAHTSVVMQPGT
ncbi:uncharacterized protein LOC124694338 [Lolium rigidum]|uniref:uncharacterized protein LOC124694338 n=1 Tax=Lolium rigidum TaxID=89674 RepID=UPI001F5D9CD3|nr:uncharacterized protein LOC124694338 [Lolium rigidum]